MYWSNHPAKNHERSVLDYILTCDSFSSFLETVFIDEERTIPLTKYATTKGIKKKVESDHNVMYARFCIEYENVVARRPRKEVFNLKNSECKSLFTSVTNENNKLRRCFEKEKPFPEECNRFFKTVDDVLHQCFKKVRVGKQIQDKEVEQLMQQKTALKIKLSESDCEKHKVELEQIEKKISDKISSRNIGLVKESIKNLENLEGNFSQLGMWKLKSRLMPTENDPPMGKFNADGELITRPNQLKKLYIDHYVERLSHRNIEPCYKENYEKKVLLWNSRFEKLKTTKSADWNLKDLRSTLKSLKNNKTRDPGGLINELFKPGVIGKDLEKALLNLVNGIKQEYFVPQTLKHANITTIYKRKGSKHDLESDRGIFVLPIFRKVIDRLIYQEMYPYIDDGMTDSNIGARKDMNIKNHLFIVYAVIHSVLNENSKCVSIHIYDLVKAFDVLWLADSMNELWDTIDSSVRDDKLGLIFEMSRSNLVAVDTAVGQTERVEIREIVTQGGTWGPMLCSNSIDRVGRFAKENGQFYKYKNLADVVPLAMVDDLLSINDCGFKSVESNTSINTLIELKKLKFHVPDKEKKSKCHYMHIGKEGPYCPGMKVHGHQTEKVAEATYLGDIVRADGKNTSNLKARVSKGLGIVSEIMHILKTISFGHRYFEIAKILREARFVNGILTNAEVWYALKNSEIHELEKLDILLLRRILSASTSSSKESLYLELGLIPIGTIIKARRLNYLHYLVSQPKLSMLYRVFKTQWDYPVKGDWVLEVKEDMLQFGISMSLEEILKTSKSKFKNLVKIRATECALENLLDEKEKHSKMKDLFYSELKMQSYLQDSDLTVEEAQNLFRFRTRTAKYKENMKSKYDSGSLACPACGLQPDCQSHSFQCEEIMRLIKPVGQYNDIFKKNVPSDVAKYLLEVSKIREQFSPI